MRLSNYSVGFGLSELFLFPYSVVIGLYRPRAMGVWVRDVYVAVIYILQPRRGK